MRKTLFTPRVYKILASVTGLLFCILTYLVYTQSDAVLAINDIAYFAMVDSYLAGYPWAWRIITTFASLPVLSFLTICIAVYSYFYLRNSRETKIYFVGMLGGLAIVAGVKYFTKLDRPGGLFSIESTFSFPSGHVALAGIFALVSSYFLVKDAHVYHKKIVLGLAVVYVGLIAISRLVLAEHWLLDVVGGLLLASTWASLVILYFKIKN